MIKSLFFTEIQFGRWGFLTVGIVYGAFHHNRLSKKEAALREIEEQQRPAREAKLAAEKKIAVAGNGCLLLPHTQCNI